MSAHSSLTGTAMAGSWPTARVMAGASAVPIGHAIDLAFYFPDGGEAPHDALIAETRRHLGGCATAIEMALRLSLDHSAEAQAALDRHPGLTAWSMIRARPTLLSPALLGHMRMRAALTLMLRQQGQADMDLSAEEPDGPLPGVQDGELGDAVAALSLAEGRWLMPGGEEQAMRPDLPAEHFEELVWTVSACLAMAARRGEEDRGGALLAAFERSGWAVLADHDEGASPIALADLLVRRMGHRADEAEMIGAALEQQRFLLFCALAARHVRLDATQVVDMLLIGPLSQVAILCRALGGSDSDFRYMLLALRPARPSLSDSVVLAQASQYAELGEDQALAALGALRTPTAFRAKLEHLHLLAGA